MAHQLTPPPGREDEGHPRLRTEGDAALTGGFDTDLHLRSDLGVRPGESDPGRMLGWVLLVVMALTVVAILALLWWLA